MPRKAAPPAKTPVKSSALHNEVKNLGLATIGVLLLVAVFLPNHEGVIIAFFHNMLFGFFGWGAFVFPVGILAYAVCALVARDFEFPIIKIIAVFWFVLSLLHIVDRYTGTGNTGFAYFRDVYRAGREAGGGVTGLLMGELLRFFLGNIGAIIALVAGIIILLVLITKRSFVHFVGQAVDKARDYYEESAANRYDEDEDFDNVIPLGRREKRRKLPPAEKKSNIVDIENDEEALPPAKILLVNEELDDVHLQKQAKNPLFARREFAHDAPHHEILTFPGSPGGNHATPQREKGPYAKPVEPEVVAPAPVAPVAHAHVTPAPPVMPAPVTHAPAAPDALPEDYFDEPVFAPIENTAEYGEEPIVKGLVAGASAAVSSNRAPLNPSDNDPLAYDEFAHANSLGTHRVGSRAVAAAAAAIQNEQSVFEDFQLPSLNLLSKNERPAISAESRTQVLENSRILEETLRSFRIEAKVVEVSVGPSVTRYDLAPGPGVKVSSISNLSNDLALSLAAQGLRIEAPIPGKSAVGIEVPNKEPQGVFLREILEDERFAEYPSKLAFAVGKDIAGSPIITDVARMPHLLIAGATGSGKSVCINTLIASLLYKARPDEVKLLMIDPKVVELSVYNGIPHLLIPVVTDPKKASGALSWAVSEMETRYGLFAESGCRDLKGYNAAAEEKLPQIVIIIDELADLMMTCKGEVEESICRLAQKARACGIHLIVATQRPSVDVITGLIKANIPSRLAFAVSSGTDSRTVLDMYGAEKLLGRGDMLFLPMGQNKPLRVQGGFISDKEVENLVAFLKAQAPAQSAEEMQRATQQVTMPGKAVIDGEVDEFFHDAVDFLLAKGKGSTSMLQRQFRIGYNRASRLMDDLQKRGIVGPEDGVKPRKVTITREEYNELYG